MQITHSQLDGCGLASPCAQPRVQLAYAHFEPPKADKVLERIVVVGAGLAGHRAAMGLHKAGFEGELVLVGDEPHRPYDRPPLSKQLLSGSMEQDACSYPDVEIPVDWQLGTPAAGLDVERKQIGLADGTRLDYDGLLITTGRRAREWPDLPDLEGFYMLRSLDDALALKAAVGGRPRVAIVGGGFIGCEVAATLRGRGIEHVAMIDIAPYPLAVLGEEVGRRAATLHERHGVELRMDASVEGFEGDGRVEAVRLADGTRVEADIVLLALGAVPNSEWLQGSGLELVKGAVRCDEHCFAVGADSVAAAGDVAAWPHPLAGDGEISIEHWAIARDMAPVAARNLRAGEHERTPFVPVPTFWSDQYDVKMKSAGLLSEADSWTVIEDDPDRPALVVEGYRGDELVGAVVWNRNKKILEYQRELKQRLKELTRERV